MRNRAAFLSCLLVFFFGHASATTLKVKVIVDNASVKATPEIGGQTLANIPLGTVLEAESKQGEWYKVATAKDGTAVSGFIHELLVEETSDEESPPAASPGGGLMKSQGEIVAELEFKMGESKNLIRQETELDKASVVLRPLLAKAFAIDDRARQRQIACEVFLWLGLAAAKRGDHYGALLEFRNMFEVDYALAKEATRNIYDPLVSNFIEQAEKQYRGLILDYSLEVATEPKEAMVIVDGKEIGLSPEIYRTPVPKFTLEVVKEGYKPYKEEIFLSQPSSRKDIVLQSIGRTLVVSSRPPGAQVLLDGQDTGQVTDCELPYVPYGGHVLELKKPRWAKHAVNIDVLEGPGPLTLSAVLTVKDYLLGQKLGGPDAKIFKLPKAIAFDEEGHLYVTDESNFKIKKFDPQGRHLAGWGDAGREFKSLKEPSGIVFDGQGFFYVTDAKAGCVMKFSTEGKFVAKWGKTGNKPDELMIPQGIAVDRSHDIYVADSGNNRIVKYSTGGVVKTAWQKQGTGPGEFLFPAGIAVNAQNEIIVVDRVHIQKFSPEGEALAVWGKAGTGEGELNRPLGLAVDAQGFIYIADTGNNRAQKFSPEGRFIAAWGSAGTADGQMTGPVGVAVNEKGSVFVLELDNSRIQEFRIPPQ
ncbi:MAG: PEGA domain-containing protein [Candidatus Aminicenantales bacterium]